MAFGSLSPVAIQQFMDANGNPLAGGKLQFYLAGTTTPTPAYADVGLTTPLANPVILDAAGRAPELFLGALAYKQVLQNAGGVTIWTADNIITPTALRSVGASSSLTGNQHDVLVPQGLISFLYFTNTAPLTIDGFAGGTPGQLLLLRALGTAPVNLLHSTASTSQTPNQLQNFVYSGPTTMVAPSGSATYVYLNGLWVLVNHEQGNWIRLPYSAGNFGVAGGGTSWTVQSADMVQMDYRLSGTSLVMTIYLSDTDIVGTPSQLVISGWPYQFSTPLSNLPAITSQAPGWGPCLINGLANESLVRISRAGFTPWAAGSGVYVAGQVWVDVL